MCDLNARRSPPLSVALVYARENEMTDAQCILIDRLSAEPDIRLIGKFVGQRRAIEAGPPFPIRWALACERVLVRRRIEPYDRNPAKKRLSDLPLIGATGQEPCFDVALVLGDCDRDPERLRSARFGELSVAYSGARTPDWIGTCRKVSEGANVTVDVLLSQHDTPKPSAVRQVAYNLKPGAVLTGAFVAEKVVLLLVRILKDLHETQICRAGLIEPMPKLEPPGYSDLFPYLRRFCRTAYERLAQHLPGHRKGLRQVWRILGGKADLLNIDPNETWEVPANPPFMADPFLFEHDGDTWVFYEALNSDQSNGWIEAAKLTENTISPSLVALKCPYHLSFPFVFREGDDIFMIPETQQRQRLEIWRATTFPTKWVLHKTAFEGQYLADSSLFRAVDGQYWLLTNLSDHFAFQDHCSELHLFAVDGPDLNVIRPHPGNPVVIGSDVARNAGAVIALDGRMYRPAQNNSFGVYGYGLNIMEITRLDLTGYEERVVRSYTPEDKRGCLGLHHLSVLGNQFVMDWCTDAPAD